MPTITFTISDEDVDRIANRLAEKLSLLLSEKQPSPVDDRLQVNRAEAARRLSCGVSTIHMLTKRGLLHPNRATGHPMYPIKELERFVREYSRAI